MAEAKKKKRRKPTAQRKEEVVRIRVTAAQKKMLTDAATKAGTGVSAWALIILLREARAAEGDAE